MSINYTTLFTRIGKLVKYSDAYLTFQGTDLMGSGFGADDILDQYAANRDLVQNVERDYIGFAGAVAGWITRLQSVCTTTLQDLQDDLNCPSSSASVLLDYLSRDMVKNLENVTANVISTPVISAASANVGNGKLAVSSKNVDGNDDERIISEVVDVLCTRSRDDGGGGGIGGSETFSVTGYPKQRSIDGVNPRGSGTRSTTVGNNRNIISNGDFESFSVTDTPDDWVIDAGTITTNIAQETTNYHRGVSALKLKGNGAVNTITLHQLVYTSVAASNIYAVGVWLRKAGTVSAGSNLAVRVIGSGLTTCNLFNADPSTLTTSYVFYSGFVHTPSLIQADVDVQITWTAAVAAGASAIIDIDDFVMQTPMELGHAQYALFAGSLDFARGDKFSVTTANNYGGIFQTWFGRFYDVQLPSTLTEPYGSTISDSLAV